MYGWIAQHRGGTSVSLCCMALQVRREGYYNWLKRPARAQRDAELISALKTIRQSHPAYGVRSMIDELPSKFNPSYGKAYRVCRDNGLLQKRRAPRGITKADPAAQAAEDLVQRDFTADAPNTKWLMDITQMKCTDGKLYLCPILDCFDASIVGFSLANHMRAELCTAALNSAAQRHNPAHGCIVHSDRGSQFTSHLFRETSLAKGFQQSMGRTGNCFDNARIESFFATLKKELVFQLPLYRMTREEVRVRIFAWIEGYYNSRRRHTANEGNLPPLVKRELWRSVFLAA